MHWWDHFQCDADLVNVNLILPATALQGNKSGPTSQVFSWKQSLIPEIMAQLHILPEQRLTRSTSPGSGHGISRRLCRAGRAYGCSWGMRAGAERGLLQSGPAAVGSVGVPARQVRRPLPHPHPPRRPGPRVHPLHRRRAPSGSSLAGWIKTNRNTTGSHHKRHRKVTP